MGDTTDLISIIVPVYKTEKYLDRCLESILSQTYDNLELILVDDGSPDGSPEICDSFARRDRRIHVIHQSNQGLPAACAAGIAVANGAYIGFVDSDDWIEPTMYNSLVQAIEAYDADIVQCGYFQDNGDQSVQRLGIERTSVFKGDAISSELLPRVMAPWIEEGLFFTPSRWNKIASAELVKSNVKFYNPRVRIGEDLTLVLAMLLDARTVVCIAETCYHYTTNLDSMTLTGGSGKFRTNPYLFDELRRIAKSKTINMEEALDLYVGYMTYANLTNEAGCDSPFSARVERVRVICSDGSTAPSLLRYSSAHSWKSKVVGLLVRVEAYWMLPVLFGTTRLGRSLVRALLSIGSR